MTTHAHLDPGAFALAGGPTGVLLLHGHTGAPPEMRLVGDYLHGCGLTAYAPLLPGHGTNPADLNTRTWPEWLHAAEAGLAWLAARCHTTFVAGLSLGALLALELAVRHPELAGVIAYSPAIAVRDRRIFLAPLLRYFLPPQPKGTDSDLRDPSAEQRLWSYDVNPAGSAAQVLFLSRQVRRDLPALRSPLLVVYSTGDHGIAERAGPYTYEHAGSPDKQLLVLHDSGHCLTVDREWQTVAGRTCEFIRQHA